MPTFASFFTGIGGFDLGLERAGWECRCQVELDPYRRGVLERWWPEVPRTEDVREFSPSGPRGSANGSGIPRRLDSRAGGPGGKAGAGLSGGVDLICGGFPCQDLSVAGRRAGLAGERSGLFFEFARIVDAVRPRWLLIENVPGLLTSQRGRDFAIVLSTLADLGYGVAWRVLDSRYFGVPQRRRRVFIVGHLGARSAEPFLPFLSGGGGHPAASGEAGPDVALASLSGLGDGGPDDNDGQGGQLVTQALTSPRNGQRYNADEHLVDFVYGLNTNRGGNADMCMELEGAPPLTGSHGNPGGVMEGQSVRRLTPIECCRLQGFPDDWLGGNEPPDSPKYAALGDAVTVPVAEWIGRRLMEAS